MKIFKLVLGIMWFGLFVSSLFNHEWSWWLVSLFLLNLSIHNFVEAK
jgi:hypothetical protein